MAARLQLQAHRSFALRLGWTIKGQLNGGTEHDRQTPISHFSTRQPLNRYGIQVNGRTAAPYPRPH